MSCDGYQRKKIDHIDMSNNIITYKTHYNSHTNSEKESESFEMCFFIMKKENNQ